MPGLVPGIHVLAIKKGVDGRDIGERIDAVLRTAMPGHDAFDSRPVEIVPYDSGTTAICCLKASRDEIAAYQRSRFGVAGRSGMSCM